MNVRLTQEQKIRILNGEDLYQVMQQVLLCENKIGRHQEHFWIVGLNSQNKILFIELLSLGTDNRVNANPPDVFRMAIYKLAGKLILVHNHPSGELQPSQADLDFMDRLLKVGQLINIEVLDHLIISEERFLSFEEQGHMATLRQSGQYEVVEREKLEIEKWKARTEAERDAKEDVARQMKLDGVDEKMIQKYTGLKLWDIRRL